MLFFVALFVASVHGTTVTTDDDVYCDAPAPWWFNQFAGEVTAASSPLYGVMAPADQQADLMALEPTYGTFVSAAGMYQWNVDTDAHKAVHNPPMRYCEVHYKCMEWVGWEYDFTPKPKDHATFGQTMGDNAFFVPMSAHGLACAYYYCASNFYNVDDQAITYYEMFLPYVMGETDNGQINTALNFDLDTCTCNSKLAAAYPNQNDADSLVAKISAGTCIDDLTTGGTQSGGWMWFCEKLSCLTARESAFSDYFTCTLDKYYNVDWEACPTNMQWVMQTYGVGYGGQFVTHLLTIFMLSFVSLIPFVLLYGTCCGRKNSKAADTI